MKLIKKTLLAFALISVMLVMIACGAKPDGTVKNFFDAAKKSDFTAMSNYMKKDGSKGEFKFDDKDQEKIVKAVFSKVNYEFVSSKVDGKNATVKAKITSLDLPKIYAKVVSDLMPTLMAQAFSNDKKDNAAEAQIMQSFLNSMNSSSAPTTTTEVDIKLVKDDNKGWLIEANDDLFNAMTGNISKAFASGDNKNSSNNTAVKADTKLYNINEEAKIGRAAFTINNFELSEGKDFDKPKEGYIFAVVTLTKKNISKDTLVYGESDFRIQTDKGQVLQPSITPIGKRLDKGEIVGGGQASGTITFEVPKDSTSLTLLYYPENEALLKFKLK